MSFKMSGFDEFGRELKKLSDNAKKLQGEHNISFDVLFNTSFMRKYTSSNSFDDFLNKGGFVVNSEKDFADIPDDVFDAHVQKCSQFHSWEAMMEKATEEYVTNQLGF